MRTCLLSLEQKRVVPPYVPVISHDGSWCLYPFYTMLYPCYTILYHFIPFCTSKYGSHLRVVSNVLMDEFEWPHWPHRGFFERHHESTGIANGEFPSVDGLPSDPSAEVHLNLNPFFWHAEIKFNLDFQTYRSWFCRILMKNDEKNGGVRKVMGVYP
jgi:hypothetical protein